MRRSRACVRGVVKRMIQAANRGTTTRGKTPQRIWMTEDQNGISACAVLSEENSKGPNTATPMWVSSTYVAPKAILPPSIPMMTDEAVAAGQIKQIITPSATMGSSNLKAKNPPIASVICIRANSRCSREKCISRGEIFKKVKKSIRKIM